MSIKQFKESTGIKDNNRLKNAYNDFKNYTDYFLSESEKIEVWFEKRLGLFATENEI